MASHPVATRLSTEHIATLCEILLKRGISKEELTSTSQILRLSLYILIIDNTPDINTQPSEESINFVHHIMTKK